MRITTQTMRGDDVQQALATWCVAKESFDRFQITRIADVTALDALRIPTWVAVRPNSHTLSVSQGKGIDPAVARTGAAMESIEGWHCEHVVEAQSVRVATAAELRLDYDIASLPGARPGLVASGRRLSWVPATGLVSNAPTWVPLDYVDLSIQRQRATGRAFTASTNGLAAALTPSRAAYHALLEVVERHAVSVLANLPVEERTLLHRDAETGEAGELIHHLRDRGCWVEVALLPPAFGHTPAVAYLWSESLPRLVAGSALRRTAEDAIVAALLEAAQSRLAIITGTREDAPSASLNARRDVPATPLASSGAATSLPTALCDDTATNERVRRLATDIANATGNEPLCVDLSHSGTDINVIRTIAPGLTFDMSSNLPRWMRGKPQGDSA